MARLPRLAVAQLAHLVLLRGHNGQAIFQDDDDRRSFLSALHGACTRERTALHGYALLPDHAWVLCTPATQQAVSRVMQSLGRRFAAAFNRRHQRRGSLWDGRFRATVVERGRTTLEAMVFVDQAEARRGSVDTPRASLWSSSRQHLGIEGDLLLGDAPEYWALGNTPFDRSAAYGRLLDEPLGASQVERIGVAAHKGWALGSPEFISQLSRLTERPLAPRPRGRPRRQGPTPG